MYDPRQDITEQIPYLIHFLTHDTHDNVDTGQRLFFEMNESLQCQLMVWEHQSTLSWQRGKIQCINT